MKDKSKIKKYIKIIKEKKGIILLFTLVFIVILLTIMCRPLDDLDELWNYNFARNFAKGLVPYKDYNMVITPLISIICGVVLKITFDELIVMRIIAAFLGTSIIYLTYKLLNILKIKKEITILYVLIILCGFYNLFCIDYNYLTLLLVLYIIYKEIKEYKKDNVFIKVNWKLDIVLGILAGLAITVKQTTGVFVTIALLGNKLLFIKNKNELKIYFKSFMFRFIGVLIPVAALLIYLLCNNALGEFINYTILGISEFDNYLSYKFLICYCGNIIRIISVIIPIYFVYAWIKNTFFETDRTKYIFLVYGLATFIICFPISDKIHFLIGVFPIIILIFNEIWNMLLKLYKRLITKKYLKIFINEVISLITFIMILFFIIDIYIYICLLLKATNYSDINHYKYIPITEKLETRINNTNKYIESISEDVKILDARAVMYMIPLDRYNKDYDMFNKGNFGYKGEERIINEIANSRDTIYFILKEEYDKNWQNPTDITDYVEENKLKKDEIEIFDIYK